MKTILHIDFNSYFATVEQQANPRLRGKPIAVTGGDRKSRTVINAASIEAKKMGIKTPMQIWEAQKICPDLILVKGDSDKYLSVTTKFLNILKDYSPNIEVFSIDEVFVELTVDRLQGTVPTGEIQDCNLLTVTCNLAEEIKHRIRSEIGEWMKVSIGISYNKLMAKLASNMQKPDGLVVIANEEEAMRILDTASLDDICGIGHGIKKRLNKMGVFNFKSLRAIPLEMLLLEFKSYGYFLYNAARGVDHREVIPFYEKAEVKSVGHRYTINHDTSDQIEIKQILLKLTELISRKLRSKRLVGKTVSCWFRLSDYTIENNRMHFSGEGMQVTIPYTNDGLEIFNAAWKSFYQMWDPSTGSGQVPKIRMIGASISNLQLQTPQNLSLLEEDLKQEKIIKALDKINDKFGEFTLQRGILLQSAKIRRMANSFLADRRFKL